MITLSNLQVNILMIVLVGSLIISAIVNIAAMRTRMKVRALEKAFIQLLESVSNLYGSFSDYLSKEVIFLEELNRQAEDKGVTTKYVK